MKYFVFADVHGFYSILKNELDNAGFDVNNEDHMLISIGDNFDRGPENYEMFLFLKEMKEKNKIILIKGNHEDLFMDMLRKGYPQSHDYTNRTYDTLLQFYRKYFNITDEEAEPSNWIEIYYKLKEDGFFDLIYDMKDYHETNKYVFTHGFIPVSGIYNPFYNENCKYKINWRDSSSQEFKESRWYNGIEMSMKYNINEQNKKIVVGHFHSSYGNVRKALGKGLPKAKYKEYEFSEFEYFKPYEDDNIIAIDSCVAFTKRINVIILED